MKTVPTKLRPALHLAIAAALASACASPSRAQDTHTHASNAQQQEAAADEQSSAMTLVKIVRAATEKYKDVSAAEKDGYALQFGCVSGSDSGAMGLHYVNGTLVNSGILDATRPHIVIYEPMPDGSLKLIGADFLLMADAWNAAHSGPPQLMGQLFHLFDSPNRFGLPAFYTLHVWAWKQNPNGAFVNWHPNVSCQSFAGQKQ
ncbi:MAG TPA: hypothetical protein VMH28_06765 [Candidatus Acidoferrales bacterium]|nr:hypothetical protein [Candidatus Acidoferrales bacterium]